MRMGAEKKKFRWVVILTVACVFASGCSLDQKISKNMHRYIRKSKVLNHHHVGLAVYDLLAQKSVYEYNSNLYFTPASNTKLLTFYASLNMLTDSIAGLRYVVRQDSLIFWGTGDPSFLHSRLKSERVLNFLKATDKKLFYAHGRYSGAVYGRGWAWDDYNDAYQTEITDLPIMGNLVAISGAKDSLNVLPRLFSGCLVADSSRSDSVFKVVRDREKNVFVHQNAVIPEDYTQQVPYKTSKKLTRAILEDLLGKPVGEIAMALPKHANIVYTEKRDLVLKEMMLPSDNFIAEQLLLLCADQAGLELNSEILIKAVQKSLLADLPNAAIWVDGSGLSRYNLITPAALIRLLEKIYRKVNDPARLFAMLPAGGYSGTLKNAYPKTDHPFLYGKTGTLSNNYSQSGYVLTKKNKVYLFSFMNNNFVAPTADVRREIAKMMSHLHEKF